MFRVEWVQSAVDELAAIWTEADSSLRQAITSAAHGIDQQLRSDPLAQGESRPEGRRVMFVSPLGVTFRIEAEGRTVLVLRVWLFRKRNPQSSSGPPRGIAAARPVEGARRSQLSFRELSQDLRR